MPGMYNTVVQELLVQQHLQRYNKNYVYNGLQALGVMSVFDQVLDAYDDKDALLDAYLKALQENSADYRRDAAALEEWATGLGSADEITCDADGSLGQKILAEVQAKVAADQFHYTNFAAVGIFRILELAKCTDPEALKRVTSELGLKTEKVTRDLATYKGILSKLNAAKELMKEYLEREKRKTEERLAEKAAATGAPPSAPTAAEPAEDKAKTAETSEVATDVSA